MPATEVLQPRGTSTLLALLGLPAGVALAWLALGVSDLRPAGITVVALAVVASRWSRTLALSLLLGGIGTLVFFGIPELFRVAQLYRLVILGAVIIVGVLFMPQGIAGLVRQRLKRWTRLAGTSPSDAARG